MLKIYICPKCFNFRIVSRKPDAICFHCGMKLEQCDLEYASYMTMTEENRINYKMDFIKRMETYKDKMTLLYKDNKTSKAKDITE